MKTTHYIARNKITELYFDGRSFNGTREQAREIEASILPTFKATWGFYDNGNGELIPVNGKDEYILKNEDGNYLIRSGKEFDWSFSAKPLRWKKQASVLKWQKAFGGKIITLPA